MKKAFILLLIFLLCPQIIFADNTPSKKFSRGIVNVATSPVEIVKEIRRYWIQGSEKTPHISVWLLSGFVKGLVEMTKRASAGTWDVVTFPIAIPKNYDSLIKPDSVFDEWPKREIKK